jgi:hypothetical protein
MDIEFETYVPSKGKTNKSKVTISRSGIIGVNEAGSQKFGLRKFKACKLHCSKDRKIAAIELLESDVTEGCVKMRLRETGASISGRGFAEHFNILPDKTTVYDCSQNERGWIIVDLTSGKERKSSKDSA